MGSKFIFSDCDVYRYLPMDGIGELCELENFHSVKNQYLTVFYMIHLAPTQKPPFLQVLPKTLQWVLIIWGCLVLHVIEHKYPLLYVNTLHISDT